jgi:hypothetical protein
MLNLNLNTVQSNLNKPAPITTAEIYYALIGGGGGGDQRGTNTGACAGGPSLIPGGKGGQGGQIITSSFIITHTDSCFITEISQGGLGGLVVSGINVRFGQSGSGVTTLEYQSSSLNEASGGLGGIMTNTGSQAGGTILPLQLNPTPGSGIQAGNATAGFCEPNSIQGQQGQGFGGGGFGATYQGDAGGVGTNGAVILSFFDPRNIYTYAGDYDEEFYTNGYRIFYYYSTGFFQFIGTSQR